MVRSGPEVPSELKKVIDVQEEGDKKLVSFANKRGVVLLAIIASYIPARISPTRTLPAYISISEEFGIETVLSTIKSKCKDQTLPVFLLVNSTGGSMSSSYKTAKAIREAFKEITVFVPHMALSGGTMLALAGNKIVMGTMSQLSAIDVQLAFDDGVQVSANALLKAKNRLDSYFLETRVEDAPYTMKRMADQLDPAIIEEWTGFQQTALEYVTDLLRKSGYNNNVMALGRKLVYDLPTHDFVVDYERAKKTGLKVVKDTSDSEGWEMMRYWLAKYLVKATSKHFIRCVIPSIEKKKTENKEENKGELKVESKN